MAGLIVLTNWTFATEAAVSGFTSVLRKRRVSAGAHWLLNLMQTAATKKPKSIKASFCACRPCGEVSPVQRHKGQTGSGSQRVRFRIPNTPMCTGAPASPARNSDSLNKCHLDCGARALICFQHNDVLTQTLSESGPESSLSIKGLYALPCAPSHSCQKLTLSRLLRQRLDRTGPRTHHEASSSTHRIETRGPQVGRRPKL